MPGPNSAVTSVDGTLDASGGVDSLKVTTIQSSQNPNGLQRNELAWLSNGTVRDGGITQRPGWIFKGKVHDGSAVYQGGWMYRPIDGSNSYIVASIGGHIFGIAPDSASHPQDLSLQFNPANPTGTIVVPPYITLTNSNIPVGTVVNIPTVAVPSVPTAGLTPTSLIGFIPSSFTAPAIASTIKFQLASQYPGVSGQPVTIKYVFFIFSYTFGGSPLTTTAVTLQNKNVPPGTVVAVKALGQATWPGASFVAPAIGANVTVPVSGFGFSDFLGPVGGSVAFNNYLQLINVGGSSVVPGQGPTVNPPNVPRAYFCQGEEFLIIQAGDNSSLPLFWDGVSLRRSIGINDVLVAAGTPGVNELPAATAMDYYMGRLWYAQNRVYSAGDIVRGQSGTGQYNFRDSILNVTENPLAVGGDGFTVPSNAGPITALRHNANINTALGQGQLFPFTDKAVYSLSVPVSRTDWIAAADASQPLQTVIQLDNGAANDRSIVSVNGDLFYQSIEPAIRSLITSVRNWSQWSNVPISSNMNRILQFTNRSLLGFSTGIYFDNRVLQSALPVQTPQGVVHQALMALDFTPLSTFGNNLQPNWEGMYEGLNILQVFSGVFNGQERAFALAVSPADSSINLWEITTDARFDNVDSRVSWYIEYPAFTWGQEFALKQVVAAEIWVDRVYGEVVFQLDYRPDSDNCWHQWHKWKICAPRNSCELTENAVCYPLAQFGESFRSTMVMPKPPQDCEAPTGRPAYVGYQFQPRLTIKGFCRIRGFLLHAEPRERNLYNKLTC